MWFPFGEYHGAVRGHRPHSFLLPAFVLVEISEARQVPGAPSRHTEPRREPLDLEP